MKDEDIVARIEKNPKFLKFVSTRNNYSIIMTILMMVVYFGYILLVAFNKQFLATKISAGAVTSIGIPLGVGVLVFTIVITARTTPWPWIACVSRRNSASSSAWPACAATPAASSARCWAGTR